MQYLKFNLGDYATMPRQPKQKRALVTVDVIIEAALIAAISDGMANVTTKRIADVAGISVGSLYEYFANKDAIFDELHKRQIQELLGKLQPILPEVVVLPPREALHLLVSTIVDVLRNEDKRYLEYLQQPEVFMRLTTETERYLNPAMLELGLRYISHNPNFLRVKNLPVALFVATNGMAFSIMRYLIMPHPTFSQDALVDVIADLVIGLLPPETETHA